MTNSQISLKILVISMFLETFDTLENIFSTLNISKVDEIVIRKSINDDFTSNTK